MNNTDERADTSTVETLRVGGVWVVRSSATVLGEFDGRAEAIAAGRAAATALGATSVIRFAGSRRAPRDAA